MRLSTGTVASLPEDVARYRYDRAAEACGIVHFGIGAFHRAHQAWYTDACMNAGERNWMICGVSMRSDAVSRQLNPQAGLFTLTEQSAQGSSTRLIGSIAKVLAARTQADEVIRQIASSDCHIVSFTVTEKGYGANPDGSLDFEAANSGFYPILEQALRRRMQAGMSGITLLSCDNLSANGKVLKRLFLEWLSQKANDVTEWFSANCTTPCTMVDRIVPATTSDSIEQLERVAGLQDEAAVFTEKFSQWVIEDDFASARPMWQNHGAQIVADVLPYETAKLRMLNAAHSLLAYCGLKAGHTYVHEAIADPSLLALTRQLLENEAMPTIAAEKDQDLAAYADALIERFANPELKHKLIQIAMDGSQKLPQRWLETIAENQKSDRQCPALLAGIAAWLRHISGANGRLDDPLAESLMNIAKKPQPVLSLFGPNGLLASEWRPTDAHVAKINSHLT